MLLLIFISYFSFYLFKDCFFHVCKFVFKFVKHLLGYEVSLWEFGPFVVTANTL